MASQEYKASVVYAGDEFFIGTPPSGHAHLIDVKGDRRGAPTPVEMLLVAVAGCTAADVQSILEKHPRKFLTFHLHHIVRGHGVSEKAVADAIELSDTKYCSVAATVRPTATITTSFEVIDVPKDETHPNTDGLANTA